MADGVDRFEGPKLFLAVFGVSLIVFPIICYQSKVRVHIHSILSIIDFLKKEKGVVTPNRLPLICLANILFVVTSLFAILFNGVFAYTLLLFSCVFLMIGFVSAMHTVEGLLSFVYTILHDARNNSTNVTKENEDWRKEEEQWKLITGLIDSSDCCGDGSDESLTIPNMVLLDMNKKRLEWLKCWVTKDVKSGGILIRNYFKAKTATVKLSFVVKDVEFIL
jgi:hypothetical protein